MRRANWVSVASILCVFGSALCLAMLLSISPGPCATEQALSPFDRLVQAARSAGSDQQARMNNWSKAVAEAEKSNDTGAQLELAFALVHLGDSCARDLDRSVATYKRGVEIRDKVGASETLGMARNLLRYGMMQQALDTQKRIKAEQLAEKENENNNPKGAEEIKAKQIQEAVDVRPALSRGLEIAQKCSAPEALQFQIMQCLSSAYYNAKQYDEAEKLDHKMIEWGDQPDNVNARGERMAGYGGLVLIYSDTNRPFDEVRTKLIEASDATPDAAQIKAIQDLYAATEKQVDDSEQHAYRAAMNTPKQVSK